VRGGRPDPSALTPADKAKIEAAIRDDVLHPQRFPKVHFASDRVERLDKTWRVEGTLDLHGVRRPLAVTVLERDGELRCEADVDQPAFGIAPYRAAFGALKVKPAVRITLTVKS